MKYQSAFLKDRKGRKGWTGYLKFKDEDGRWRECSRALKAATKTEARRELAAWRAEMEDAAEHEAEARTDALGARTEVPDYVAGMVDRLEASGAIEPSTASGYRTTVNHIRRRFAGVAVADLTAAEVQAWEADLTAKGLGSSTVGKCHRLLKQAMKEACALDLIKRNPLDAVRPPKRRPVHEGINALDLDGRTRLLDALDAMELTPVTVGARVALYTGLRRGEVCGLRWADIDPEAGVLWVRRSIGKGGYVKEPKTGKGRDVALPASLAAVLADWRAFMEEAYRAAGAVLPRTAYVLGYGDRFMSPELLGKQWATLAGALGIRGTEGRIPTFHDLRHTWATLYLAAGGDVKTAASNLGHADVSMTLNTYASADPDAKRRAAVLVEGAMRAPEGAAIPFRAKGEAV